MSTSGDGWFSSDNKKGISQLYKNSDITAFVDAEEYYADLRTEVEGTKAGDLICWIGFDGSGDTPMPIAPSVEPVKKFPPRKSGSGSDVEWFGLLKQASDDRDIAIRVLLNLHPSPKPLNKYKGANFDLVAKLNTLKNCLAINDFRYLYLNGTHHQKLILVYNARKGLMAYIGTCDIETGRIVQRWGEVQCKVMGDTAVELFGVFQKRWSEHTQIFKRIGSANSYLKPVSQMKTTAAQSGNFLVQTATTYGNPDRINPLYYAIRSATPLKQHINYPHRLEVNTDNPGLFFSPFLSPVSLFRFGNDFFTEKEPASIQLINDALNQDATYAFAPNGHTGIYHTIKKAIEETKQYIYLEDQYLVCDMAMGKLKSMLDMLSEKLREPKFKKLIIFCTRIDDINDEFQGTGWKHRNNFVSSLVSAESNKVEVCQYKSKGNVGCPGNAWSSIFSGSANCNRRGYSHDSELDIGVYDQNKMFVKDLRIRIWKRRLNAEGITRSPIQDNELNDFLSASKFWENPDQYGLPIENSKKSSFAPSHNPDLDLQSFKAMVTSQPGMAPQINGFLDKLKMDGIWDFIVDPEGT